MEFGGVRRNEFDFAHEPEPFAQACCILERYQRIIVCEKVVSDNQVIVLRCHIERDRHIYLIGSVKLFEFRFEPIALRIGDIGKPFIALCFGFEENDVSNPRDRAVANMGFAHIPRHIAKLQ